MQYHSKAYMYMHTCAHNSNSLIGFPVATTTSHFKFTRKK